ncbi:hypothetical protein EJB05_37240, partial [Eragrostis curvula]
MLLHRLATLIWICAVLAAVSIAAGALPPPSPLPQPSSKCQRKCGDVEIPYPFGIRSSSSRQDDNCAMADGFYLSCKYTDKGVSRPFHTNVEVLNISLLKGQARMLNYISSSCYNTTTMKMDDTDWHLNFIKTPYRFSDTDNKFTVIGCQALAYIADEYNTGKYMSGCVAMCRRGDVTTLTNGSCSGIGCCETAIPKGLQYYRVWFDKNFNKADIYSGSQCSYAVLMDSSNFTFVQSYATSPEFNNTNHGRAPLVVDWAIGHKTCKDARTDPDTYACVSSNSDCFDLPSGKGYICNCSRGYEGNPYLQDGCKDIDECKDQTNSTCSVNANCINTPGGFECVCPPQYPIGSPSNGTCQRDQALSSKAKIAIGISVSVLVGLILFLGTEWIKHKRRIARQDHMRKINKCFELNGGQLLLEMMKVECNISFKLYSREEIKLATNNFNDSEIIGQGGQGIVYRGHNLDPDNNLVAVKRCKGIDESRRVDFVKELLILSRVNHDNIVKLLGCSLQFDVPVLVYEYVPNKTLQCLIHSQDNNYTRTLDIRLKIATKSAQALAYLHSLNHPILHGDVKSANILLGPDLSAKVSDFGCSMIGSTDENVPVVKGTLGYLDPEYLLNFELTDKSDVYSFGVVLLELLTRKKAISKEKESLASVFQEAVKKGKLYELVDSEIMDDQENMDVVHQLAELAGRCLIMAGEHRPTMKEVAKELRLLDGVIQQRPGALSHSDRPIIVPGRSITNTAEYYSGGETTDYYSLRKKAVMSIEVAR